MRILACTLAMLMSFSLAVEAGQLTDLREELNRGYEELLETESLYQQKKEAAQQISDLNGKRSTDLANLQAEITASEAELQSSLLVVEQHKQKLARINQQIAQEQTNSERFKQALLNSVKSLLDHGQDFWTTFIDNLSWETTIRRNSLLDYQVYSNRQAYVKASSQLESLKETRQRLVNALDNSRQTYDQTEQKMNELKTGYQELETELNKGSIEISSLRQEINLLQRRLYEQEKQISEMERNLASQIGTTGFPTKRNASIGWPLPEKGRVSSDYGLRIHPIFNEERFHTGVDLAVPTGTPIKAVADGTVITSTELNGYGLTVILDHGQGISTLYAHASKLLVEPGEQISKGQTVALVGSTGFSTGPHLHFEVRENGEHVNPWTWLE